MDEQFEEDIQQKAGPAEQYYKPKHNRFVMSRVTYYALIVIFAAIFVLSGIYLGGYFLEDRSAQNEYNDLASLYQQGMSTTQTTAPTGSSTSGSEETRPPVILPELQALYEKNNDLVGWLDFPYENLNVSYPVVQSLYDSDFYLGHSFYGEENESGCPYIPAYCDVFKPSDNLVINGHYRKTGGMFANLTWYRDKSYWENHQTFTFSTLYERHTYRIFAVFKTAAKQYTEDGTPWGYPYHRTNEFQTQEEFDRFVADIKGAAFNGGGYQGWCFYDTGVTPEYGDKLLCLSTCEYTMKDPDGTVNGRLVIAAVRIE